MSVRKEHKITHKMSKKQKPLYPPKDFFISGHGIVDATIGQYNSLPKLITLYTRTSINKCIDVRDEYAIVRDKSIGWKGRKQFHDGIVNLFVDFESKNKNMALHKIYYVQSGVILFLLLLKMVLILNL
jgi:hypothetical protein